MAYTNIDDPSAYFQTALYTGNGGTLAVTNDGNSDLQPDLVWTKRRDSTSHNALVDSSRGASKQIYTNLTAAEETVSGVTAFNTDGFTLGSNGTANASSGTFAGWQWKANGGTTSSNTDGDITSTVQADTTAGFSIMTYAGTTGDVHTIGHGLGVTPDVWIVKQRSNGGDFQNWFFWHKDMAASNVVDNRMLFLNLNSALGTYTGINAVTSSTIRVKSSTTAQNGYNYVAYAFAEKQGYSKFGKYVGNGSSNGAFVYTGFAPAFVMLKDTSQATNWEMFDVKRNPFNVRNLKLGANLSVAENGSDLGNTNQNNIDILSNGFKMRTGNTDTNVSGDTYIYMAFAENPFTTSTGIPTTAR